MQLKTALLTAALVAAGLTVQPVVAGTATGTFDVTATVVNSCKVTSTSDIAFGNYDPANLNNTTDLDASGSVTVRCTKNAAVNVALQQGNNPTGASTCTAPARQMKDSAGDLLAYDIYQDSGRTTAWGCDASNSQNFTSAGIATPKTYTTYGRIPAGQDVPAATDYTDTVTTTVTF